MAYLYRLILFFFSLFVLVPDVHASFAAIDTSSGCKVAPCYNVGYKFATPDAWTYGPIADAGAVCGQAAASYVNGGWKPMNPTITSQGSPPTSAPTCVVKWYYNNVYQYDGNAYGTVVQVDPVAPAWQCPANSTLSGSNCTCNSGSVEGPASGGWSASCVPPNFCQELANSKTPAGSYSGVGSVGPKRLCDTRGISSSGDASLPGCVVYGDATFAARDPSDGLYHWTAGMVFTGEKCAPDVNASPDASGSTSPPPSSTNGDNSKCPVGKVPGQVNGVTVCVDPGTSTPTTTTSTKSNTTTNPDGTTTTQQQTTTTECGPTGCTTTTTTTTTNKDASGNTTGTSTTSNNGTCAAGSPGCSPDGGDKEPSRFGGACAAGFTCEGDAIFCAMAQEQHRRDCALFDTPTEESALYASEKGKTGAQYQNENVSAPAHITPTNLLGVSGSCQLNKTVTIWGREVTLPFSQVCDALSYMGTLLLTVSFLLSYRIVSRG